MATKRKVVIDCDPGNDDAEAILMALKTSDVDVVAITCVEGNTHLKQAGLNALRTLQAANRMDIPVYLGVSSPLLGIFRPRNANVNYHGSDAFGDMPDPNAPDESNFQQEHAVEALIRISKDLAGELELVAIGPLTNVAMTIRMDPQFGSRLKSCNIMGGNYQGRGNVTAAAEFNFYFDPEAASVTLNELGCPITMVPWETCYNHGLSWAFYHSTRDMGTPIANFMKKIDTKSYAFSMANKYPKFVPADEALMACFLNNAVIKAKTHVYATVELRGELTWGQVVVDWTGLMKKAPNVTIVTDLNQSLYEAEIMKAFTTS